MCFKRPVVVTPPVIQKIDVVNALFRTKGRNVGPCYIYDSVNGNQIVRVAYDPKGDIETHSRYEIDPIAGGIRATFEETWRRDPVTGPTTLKYAQEYVGKPLWIDRLTLSPGEICETHIPTGIYNWTEFAEDGVTVIHHAEGGTFEDWTKLTCSFSGGLTLLEFYKDDSTNHTTDPIYCVQDDYDVFGLAKLNPGSC